MSRRQTIRRTDASTDSIEAAIREAVAQADGSPNGDILALAFIGACGYRARVARMPGAKLAALISETWVGYAGFANRGAINGAILVGAALGVYIAV